MLNIDQPFDNKKYPLFINTVKGKKEQWISLEPCPIDFAKSEICKMPGFIDPWQ